MIIDENTNKCDSKACFAVPWAGKIQMCCKDHANQLVILGNVIGQPIQPRPIKTDEDCYLKDLFPTKEEKK